MDEETQEPIGQLHDHLTSIGWPNLMREENRLFIDRPTPITLIEKKDDLYALYFAWYRLRTNEYGVSEYGFSKITFDDKTNLSEILWFKGSGYQLSYDGEIKGILQLTSGGVNHGKVDSLELSTKHKKIATEPASKTLQISPKKYLEVLVDAKEAHNTADRYGKSVSRYLINKFSKKHLNKDTKLTTTIEKGEFDFLVHRLNLSTKKTKKDYEKYLSKKDISSLQDLVLDLVHKEVFEPNFLRELDEYFIREKLKGIIALGREILSLKSGDLETKKAKEIIAKLGETKPIAQLETLWQKFFEKYLLYLIFSYKEIYPKVELTDLETDKKYPDFIGINHYNGVDIIEIKTHLTPALVYDKSHKNFSFSSHTSKAIIQVVNYLDAIKQQRFKNDTDRSKITKTTYEENLYRPRGVLIISSWGRLSKNNPKAKELIKRDFTKLRNSLHNIEILTFDEILDIADHYCEKIVKRAKKKK